MKHNKLITVGIVCMVVLLLLCTGICIKNKKAEREYEALREQAFVMESQEKNTELITEQESESEEEILYCEKIIDFDPIIETNQDVYAWIVVPGTDVDYPVLQSEEDNYYLTHNLDHSGPRPGCIYSNSENTKDFGDFATILYGHDMNNGTMFGTLRKFYDRDFFDENDSIIIYTPECRLFYQIIETRRHTDEYLPYEFMNFVGNGKQEFLQLLDEDEDDISFIRDDVSYGEEDKYLILSTCIKTESNNRFLIIGKLIETAYYE